MFYLLRTCKKTDVLINDVRFKWEWCEVWWKNSIINYITLIKIYEVYSVKDI